MTIDRQSATAILRRTPAVLNAFLRDLPEAWISMSEGSNTWNAVEVLGHLIHGERTDWIPRAQIILERGESTPFEPFDMVAHLAASRGRPLNDILDEFHALRDRNLDVLDGWHLASHDLDRCGTHPEFGQVTLSQLIATWAVHDLTHLAQIARVMAKRYDREVGPWKTYLRILNT